MEYICLISTKKENKMKLDGVTFIAITMCLDVGIVLTKILNKFVGVYFVCYPVFF